MGRPKSTTWLMTVLGGAGMIVAGDLSKSSWYLQVVALTLALGQKLPGGQGICSLGVGQ